MGHTRRLICHEFHYVVNLNAVLMTFVNVPLGRGDQKLVNLPYLALSPALLIFCPKP